jgi:hypothetical protein
MKKLTKKKFIFILIPTGLLIIITVVLLVNPLIGPNWFVRMHILMRIPIGTSMEDVIEIAGKNKRWGEPFPSYGIGVTLKGVNKRPRISSLTGVGYYAIIGEKSMEVHLGTYWLPFRADVTAFFAFCEDGKLIDVFIRKDWDSI